MIMTGIEIFCNEVAPEIRRSDCPQPVGGVSVKISGKEILEIVEKSSYRFINADMNNKKVQVQYAERMRYYLDKLIKKRVIENGI